MPLYFEGHYILCLQNNTKAGACARFWVMCTVCPVRQDAVGSASPQVPRVDPLQGKMPRESDLFTMVAALGMDAIF